VLTGFHRGLPRRNQRAKTGYPMIFIVNNIEGEEINWKAMDL
jgi:hypothetical protein